MRAWLKKEFFHLLPVFVFFFVTFCLINMTDGLMSRKEHGTTFSLGQITFAALVIAKIFLVLDHLPVINAFSDKPLIYKIIWKTFLYFTVSLLVRLEIVFVPYYMHAENPTIREFSAEFNWPRFWGVQIWFLVLFFHFVTSRECVNVIGPKKIRKIFLGF